MTTENRTDATRTDATRTATATGTGEHPAGVLVVGAGPTGLLLAGDLAAAGVPVTVLERRGPGHGNLSRAFGVHARTLELLDARGLADELVATGHRLRGLRLFRRLSLDLTELPSRFPYLLITPSTRSSGCWSAGPAPRARASSTAPRSSRYARTTRASHSTSAPRTARSPPGAPRTPSAPTATAAPSGPPWACPSPAGPSSGRSCSPTSGSPNRPRNC